MAAVTISPTPSSAANAVVARSDAAVLPRRELLRRDVRRRELERLLELPRREAPPPTPGSGMAGLNSTSAAS